MTPRIVAAGCLVTVAVVVGMPPGVARRRLRSLRQRGARLQWLGLSGRTAPIDPTRAAATLGGVAVALFIGGWLGVAVGVVTGVALDHGLRRLEPRAARVRRLRIAADLPLAADLLAAALRAGAPVDRAATAVGTALPGPLGERLLRVSRALRLGATPEEAWRHLVETGPTSEVRRVADAAVRSASSGAALSAALVRLAEEFRMSRTATLEATARRAGVLVVLPLGLCFLPAFVLAGLVPVIVAVLGDVL